MKKLLFVLDDCIFLFALTFIVGCSGGVSAPPPLQLLAITSSIPPGGAVGGTYGGSSNGYTFQASGGVAPYKWSWSAGVQSALPPGLNFTSGGVMSGVPTAPGIYDVIVTVTDSGLHVMQASAEFKIRIAPGGVLAIAFAGLPGGTVGTPYGIANHASNDVPYTAFTLGATGGSGDYAWSWVPAQGSSLPPGLTLRVLSLTSGGGTRCCVTVQVPVIEGTPSGAGSYSVVVTVTDSETPPAQAKGTFKVAISAATAASAKVAESSHVQHTRYKLIDLGTFGGPASYFSNGFDGILNRQGTAAGWADTSTPDPEPTFCFNFDCFVSHAFRWQNGDLTDLESLATGWSSAATWVNDSGQVVGISENGVIDPLIGFPEFRAVLWKNGGITDLGTLGGGYESIANAVNDRGQVVGFATNTIPDPFSFFPFPGATQSRAFLWQEGAMQDLGTLGGPDATAVSINDRGQVAGQSYTNSTPNPVLDPCGSFAVNVPTEDPFIWKNGKMTDLGTLGGTCGFVTGQNDRGQVIGQSDLAGDLTSHPFLWTESRGMQDLGTLGGDTGVANWINNDGDIAGKADLPGSPPQNHNAVLWKNGVIIDLGTLPGDACANAYYVNTRGQVVGTSENRALCSVPTGEHAFLWEEGGPMVDLNSLIPRGSSLQLTFAVAINDRGEIAGFGVPAGCAPQDVEFCGHAYVLIPCERDGETGCGANAEAANVAAPRSSAILLNRAGLVKSPQPGLTPRGTLAAWRVQMLGRYQVSELGTQKN
jgi:probable HAF family extracellular repeat protein